MRNIYQSKTVGASPTPAMPDEVLVSLGEIAGSASEGLLALAVGTGLQVMYAMMDADVTALAGPKGQAPAGSGRGSPWPCGRIGDVGRAASASDSTANPHGRLG